MLVADSECLGTSAWFHAAASDIELSLMDSGRHPEINKALSKTLLSGGKRVRPLLTCMMADIFGLDRLAILPYARAIELVHSATLSHDDVIDNAATRRHHPSLHVITSNKKAILAGDYLLAEALIEVSRLGPPELVKELSQVILDLSLGEWKQLDLCQSPTVTLSEIEEIAVLKTGSVLSWCCMAPAYIASAYADEIDLCRKLGRCLGILFQSTDDILDFSDTDTGKPLRNDLAQNALNAVLCQIRQAKVESADHHGVELVNADHFDEKSLCRAIDAIMNKAKTAARDAHIVVDLLAGRAMLADRKSEALAMHRLIDHLLYRKK